MTTNSTVQHLVLLLALKGVIFVTAGIAKTIAWDSNVSYMATRPLPFIPVLLAAKIAAWTCLRIWRRSQPCITSSVPPTIKRISELWVVSSAGGWALDSAFRKRSS